MKEYNENNNGYIFHVSETNSKLQNGSQSQSTERMNDKLTDFKKCNESIIETNEL